MKKIVTIAILLISCFTMAMAQQSEAKIKFDKVSHDFGTFSENAPVQECVFSFINEGSAPLVINQAFASCGCTIPAYTKAPVMPGKKGQIKITYNGKGKQELSIGGTCTNHGACPFLCSTSMDCIYLQFNITEVK